MPDLHLTTSKYPDGPLDALARSVAARTGLEYRPRIGKVEPPALVIERSSAYLLTGERKTKSHPGMGLVRIRRIRRGEIDDPLIIAAQVRPGDRILDCTFGFGQDSLVLAWAVGEEGRVVALEASRVLVGLSLAGMRTWDPPAPKVIPRIELLLADYRTYLADLPPKSFDVVVLDPMFRQPRAAQPDFVTLRAFAEESPLTLESLELARRAARRCVVVKDAWPGHELTRLGIEGASDRRVKDLQFGIASPI